MDFIVPLGLIALGLGILYSILKMLREKKLYTLYWAFGRRTVLAAQRPLLYWLCIGAYVFIGVSFVVLGLFFLVAI